MIFLSKCLRKIVRFAHVYYTTTSIIHYLSSKVYHNSLKNADISPVFQKEEIFLKNNIRPVSILSSI